MLETLAVFVWRLLVAASVAVFEASRRALSYGLMHGSGGVSIGLLCAFFFYSFLGELCCITKIKCCRVICFFIKFNFDSFNCYLFN